MLIFFHLCLQRATTFKYNKVLIFTNGYIFGRHDTISSSNESIHTYVTSNNLSIVRSYSQLKLYILLRRSLISYHENLSCNDHCVEFLIPSMTSLWVMGYGTWDMGIWGVYGLW